MKNTNKIIGLTFLTIAMGILGGMGNYCMDPTKDQLGSSIFSLVNQAFVDSIVLGVIAAFVVQIFALFIPRISPLSQQNQNPHRLLIFMGFCVLPALFSRPFLIKAWENFFIELQESNTTETLINNLQDSNSIYQIKPNAQTPHLEQLPADTIALHELPALKNQSELQRPEVP